MFDQRELGMPTTEASVTARRLPATDPRRIGEDSQWEVSYGCEATGWRIIGWVEERRLRGAHSPVYFATAVHPGTGKHYQLEGNTDFDERVNTVADFHLNPMTSRQHLGRDAGR
jgi:hypothetical protein